MFPYEFKKMTLFFPSPLEVWNKNIFHQGSIVYLGEGEELALFCRYSIDHLYTWGCFTLSERPLEFLVALRNKAFFIT